MKPEPRPSFIDQALTHLALIDATDLSERLRLHLHLARMFLELEQDGRIVAHAETPGACVPRSGDAMTGAAG